MGWHARASDLQLEKVCLMFSSWMLTFSIWRQLVDSGQGGKRSNSGRNGKSDGRGEYKKAWLKAINVFISKRKFFLSLWGWTLLLMSTRLLSTKVNKTYEIYKVRNATQNSGETLDTYCTQLRRLAQTREFDKEDKEIKSHRHVLFIFTPTAKSSTRRHGSQNFTRLWLWFRNAS